MLANNCVVFGNAGKQLDSLLSVEKEPNHVFDAKKNKKITKKETQQEETRRIFNTQAYLLMCLYNQKERIQSQPNH